MDKRLGTVELHVKLALVVKDIGDYLQLEMDKMKPSSSTPEKSNFVDRIESNFVLARWALEYSTNPWSSMKEWGSSDVTAAASKSLPAFYRARLAEIQLQQSVDKKTPTR